MKIIPKFPPKIFIKSLAAIYLIAFISLFSEVQSLFFAKGLIPIAKHPDLAQTLFNFDPSDGSIYFALAIGLLAAIFMFFGVAEFICAVLLFVIYFSFVKLGAPFFNFQWDILLLETGFALMLYLLLYKRYPQIIWIFRIIIFKLMFMSALVKILSNDPAWLDLTALSHHYYTQPLPNPLSFYFHNLPLWFHQLSCAFMFLIELVCPFLIFMGKAGRKFAFFAFLVLMLIVMLSGNYTFFNLLTIVLSITLLIDERDRYAEDINLVSAVVVGFYIVINLMVFALRVPMPYQKPMLANKFSRQAVSFISEYHLAHPYGLFAAMTKQRLEILIQGRQDGEPGWRNYVFKYKPYAAKEICPQIAPLQARVDWQMWFAALGNYRQNPWLIKLMQEILADNPAVMKLFRENPYPEGAPKYVRAIISDYKFNNLRTYAETGEFWKVKKLKAYTPTLTAK